MACPLTVGGIRAVLGGLPATFDTLTFIAACPRGGQGPLGRDCPAVRAAGGLHVCGRSLATFASHHDGELAKTSGPKVSPARWRRPGVTDVTAPPPPRPAPARRATGWPEREQARQVEWKERVAGVAERGLHDGRPADFLFPEDRWIENILPPYREDVRAHLERLDVAVHEFAHHVRSSQVFALNLAAPFLRAPEALAPVLAAVLPPGAGEVAAVERVEAEVVDPDNRLREPGTRGSRRTSADLGVWWRDRDGRRRVTLFEVKYTESGFGACGKGRKHGGACDGDGPGVVRSDGGSCPLTRAPYGRPYWALLRAHGVFRPGALEGTVACPFRHGGYQLMRNQLLAALLESDDGVDRADFAVLLHDDNPSIRRGARLPGGAGDVVAGWSSLLRRPERFHAVSARRWLEAAALQPALADWASRMLDRYFAPPDVAASTRPAAVRPGHRRAVAYLGSPELRAVRAVYDEVCGPGGVYFRPVDGAINVIALHPAAPGYVGHRAGPDDTTSFVLKPGGAAPTPAELRARHARFEAWLPTVRRRSDEERAVGAWLRARLARGLALGELGAGWVFLNQEWRLPGEDGKGRKTDVLAVHLPTGRLGIVEAKSRAEQRPEALAQLAEYVDLWARHGAELAPFFTDLLRAQGRLYDDAEAAAGRVTPASPATFFAWPGPRGALNVEAVRPA